MGTDKLFDLISRMTRSEKRYFTLSAKKFTDKTSNYLKLFNAINEMEVYDEQKLIKKAKFIKNLNSEKKYLYETLLDNLRSFNKKKFPKTQVTEMILDADFLRRRGLYEQSSRVLQKAKKLAEYHEFHLSLLDINRIERKLQLYVVKKNLAQSIEALGEEWLETYQLVKEEYEYFDFQNKAGYTRNFDHAKINQDYIANFEQTFSNTLELEPESINSVRVNFRRFLSIISYFTFKNDEQNQISFYAKALSWMRSTPQVRVIMLESYRIFLINYLDALTEASQWSIFPDVVKELKSLPEEDFHQEGLASYALVYYELIYYMNICDFVEAKKLANQFDEILEKYQKTVTVSTQLAFQINIAILYFVLEEFKESLKYFKSIVLSSEKENRQDILRLGRMFKVILFHELEDVESFEPRYRSFVRYFRNLPVSCEFELLVLDHVNKMQKVVKTERKPILVSLQKALLLLRDKNIKVTIAGLEEVLIWIISRITNQPIAKILRDQNNSKN
ncbi:MAG: hypothetical protein AB8G15_02980 [Saprospiraceae bacterium]